MANMFLRLDHIDGESLDFFHEKEIEIVDFMWEASHEVDRAKSDEDAAKIAPLFSDFTVTKFCDKASATLLQFFTVGTIIETGTITLRKRAGDNSFVNYLVIDLTKVRVTSFSWSMGEDNRISELIGLNAAQFFAKYMRQGSEGDAEGIIDFGFDTVGNAEVAGGLEVEFKFSKPPKFY
jgi:type VI protein secretion system component Hcp